ncbi:MAG: ribosome biogenesis GTP-binding protein YihA/YsxC [Alphaproteobacteria bacterium]
MTENPNGVIAPEETQEAISYGRKLFASPVEFVLGAAALHQVPETQRLEIAFVGRSNVGKSTLINALLGRNNIAKTSSTPGRTQQINFFTLGEEMMLADLPGYGYAKAPIEQVAQWHELIFNYLRGRVELRRVLILIDSRHGIKKNDLECMDLLDNAAVNWQVILTKADKVKKMQLDKVYHQTVEQIRKRPASHPKILITSSEKHQGLDEMRASLAWLLKD